MTIEEIIKRLEEIKEDREIIFNQIAKLYDKIEAGEIETREILERLAYIQQCAK